MVEEWVFTVKLQTDVGYNKGTVWAEMMGRIQECCQFEVRNFMGQVLQMSNIGCALPRVVLLLARVTDDQQRAALRHFQTCVKCGGSLAAMSTVLRSLIRNPAQPISCQGVSAKSLQLTRALSTRETKKAERDTKKAERVANLEIWQREVQKPAALKLRKTFAAVLDALSDNTISEEHQVEDMSLGPRLVLKPSYFRALTNEAGLAKMLFLAVHGHMVVGQVAELKHPGIFHLSRQKPPPEAANSQFFPCDTSTYSCFQMAAGRRDNSAGSQGYAFVVAKSVCLPVSPHMLGTHTLESIYRPCSPLIPTRTKYHQRHLRPRHPPPEKSNPGICLRMLARPPSPKNAQFLGCEENGHSHGFDTPVLLRQCGTVLRIRWGGFNMRQFLDGIALLISCVVR
jgi:hypothetical protein